MPRYIYKCEHCNAEFERQVEIRESAEQFCRDCDEQLVMVPAVPAWFKPGKYGKGNR